MRTPRSLSAAGPLAAGILLSSLAAQDSPAPPDVTYADAFPDQADFDRPLYLDHHPADPDHYWVVEQYGHIYRIPAGEADADGAADAGARQLVADFGDICYHPRNGGHNEEGLLGFAFHPAWDGDGAAVFVYYSHEVTDDRDTPRESVLERYVTRRTESGGYEFDMDSAQVVLRVDQPYGNHNGGTILFGPDRMLYVALGDGGAANDPHDNGQDPTTLLGSVLRIDVRESTPDEPYRIPADNPFADSDDGRPEVWAYGVRNPWRMSFDRANGEMWCGDVGQNKWEEVGRLIAGGNHGWNKMEGLHPFPPGSELSAAEKAELVMPAAEYEHPIGLSVTGGFVYRGAAIPALQGAFVYGDYVTCKMWAVHGSEPGSPVVELPDAPAPLSAFAEEPDGELLLLGFDGRIRRLLPAAE